MSFILTNYFARFLILTPRIFYNSNIYVYIYIDFTIYDEEIEAVDPSGIQLKGLENYRTAILFFQTFIQFWFSVSLSKVQYRMVYDFARSSIKISWSMELVPKFSLQTLLTGVGMTDGRRHPRPLYVDGISYYNVDPNTAGTITEHKIERLLINQNPVVPPYGIFNILQQHDIFQRKQQVAQPVPQTIPGGVFGCNSVSN